MKALIIRFWPAIVPMVLFLWWYLSTNKDRKSEEDTPELDEKTAKLWIWSLGISLFIAIICVIILAFSTGDNRDSVYVPAEYKDGKLIPGQVIPKSDEK